MAKKKKPSIWAPMGPKALQAEATKRVEGILGPQEDALREMSKAVAGILGQRAPQVQESYSRAGQNIAGLAGDFSSGMASRIAAAQAASADFSNLAGAPTAPPALDPEAIRNAAYAPGYVAGSSLEEQGAAAGALAAAQPGIHAAATTDQLRALAAQRPELRAQIIQELYDREIQKAQVVIQQRAQGLYERQFGEEKRQNRAQERIQILGLQLASMKERRMVEQAIAEGREVDASASKLLGYLVDQNGRPILGPNGKRIKVRNDANAGDRRKAYQDSVQEARDIRGQPIANTNMGPASPGKYLARPGAKGVFPAKGGFPATTNDPKKARWDGQYTFHEALNYLVHRFGIARKRARAALIAAGWPAPARTRVSEGARNSPH